MSGHLSSSKPASIETLDGLCCAVDRVESDVDFTLALGQFKSIGIGNIHTWLSFSTLMRSTLPY